MAAVDETATYLENTEGDNSKFWSISITGDSTRVRYGPIGEEGFVSEKQHKDEKAAEKFHAKMIKEKTGKGYEHAAKDGKRKAATDDGGDDDDEKQAPAKKAKVEKKAPAKKAKVEKKAPAKKAKVEKKAPAKEKKAKEQPKEATKAPAAPAAAAAAAAAAAPAARPSAGDDNKLDALRYMCEYAKSGRSSCKASKAVIPQGDLRVGKVVENPWRAGKEMSLWYVPEALFDSFRKGNAGKNRLTSTDDCEGFDDLKKADQERLQTLIDDENEFQEGLAVRRCTSNK